MSEAQPTDTPTPSGAASPTQRALRERARVALALGDACAHAELPAHAERDEDAPAQAIALYRDAVYWSLCAQAAEGEYEDLAAAFEGEIVRIRTIVQGDDTLAALREALLTRGLRETFALPLEVQRESAARVGAFAHALFDVIDAERRRARARIERAGVIALAAIALGGVGLLARHALREDLARDARWEASSASAGFAQRGQGARAPTGPVGAFFHTAEERSPWVRLDLGAARTLREVVVENRSDCCAERAVPLALELSLDGRGWSEVARRTSAFNEWTARFTARPTRYLRLRALRRTALHLHGVSAR